ncbi:MAG: translation initiation inhibitor [Phycisphaerae bacterium]|nr:translation initiation inhibitor [Phycisphaerae bacterium]
MPNSHFSVESGRVPATVSIARFGRPGGAEEIHLVVTPAAAADFAVQLAWVNDAYEHALASIDADSRSAVFRRFFCDDLPHQAALLDADQLASRNGSPEPCGVSWVGQPPLPPARVVMWAYHISDAAGPPEKTRDGATLSLRRGDLTHMWTTGVTGRGDDVSAQTRGIFETYESHLRSRGLTLADHLVRTWLFVRDIDAEYQGLVDARREFFTSRGLTSATHFVASSGIEGTSADTAANVSMDAYAIAGLRGEQVEYIRAPGHLSPTHVYGVTFERATSVSYRDRRHIIISGTASIDRDGNIVHPGDVERQLDRALENIAALLDRAGATLADMSHFVVYVRDPSDRAFAHDQMRERFGDIPLVVVTAPVCRPGWLVEIEGMAIVPADSPNLPRF